MRGSVRLEEDRVSTRVVWGGFVFLVCGTIVFSGFALLLHDSHARGHLFPQPRQAEAAISGVRQTLIDVERPGIQQQRQAQDALDRWGWVDQRSGIVSMPIDEAARSLEGEPLR